MIKNIFKDEQIAELKSIIDSSRNVVLACHKSPDGDAVGSTMGFCQVLKQIGKNARGSAKHATRQSAFLAPG